LTSDLVPVIIIQVERETRTTTDPADPGRQRDSHHMAVLTKKGSAVANSAYGKPLKSYKDKDGKIIVRKLKYDFDYSIYPTNEDMVEAGDTMALDAQRKVRNKQRKTKARQAAFTLSLTNLGIEAPNAESDSLIRLKNVAAGLYGKYVSQGMAEADAKAKARAKASELLEEDWPKSDEDEDEDDEDETDDEATDEAESK